MLLLEPPVFWVKRGGDLYKQINRGLTNVRCCPHGGPDHKCLVLHMQASAQKHMDAIVAREADSTWQSLGAFGVLVALDDVRHILGCGGRHGGQNLCDGHVIGIKSRGPFIPI